MKTIAKFNFLLLITLVFTSCFEDLDDTPITTSQINDFVYRAMDSYYLYKEDVPSLVEDKLSSPDYNSYIASYSTPESIFESLIYDRQNIDRFSWITSNYIALEQQFQGVSATNGMEFGLRRYSEGSDAIFGYVRFVLPNTSASSSSLERGDIFYGINGTSLTVNNFRELLSNDSYTLNLASYNTNGTENTDDDSIDPTSETINLTKQIYTENPVLKTEILQVENKTVGYLMYNGFVADFNTQLNNAFSTFQSNNVQELVIDLRYNPGGSVNTARLLGSMVTGQFNDQVFAKLLYNNQLQNFNTDYTFTSNLDDNTAVNSLNLGKVYVLTTGASASASEMIINSLSAYIDVVHIGGITTGKSQASVTLYDSSDFRKVNVNPSHTYALQPLVAKTVNKNNVGVPHDGLVPTIEISESIGNLGVLGDANEPLLAEALAHIISTGRISNPDSRNQAFSIPDIGDNNDFKPLVREMYID